MHSKDISHRDMKEENCLIGKDNQVKIIGGCKLLNFSHSSLIKRFWIIQATSFAQTDSELEQQESGNPWLFSVCFGSFSQFLCSPEIMRGQSYTTNVDVFSFGIMMFNFLLDTDDPYNTAGNKDPFFAFKVGDLVEQGLRPEIPSDFEVNESNEWFVELMKKCWDENPKNRPSAKQIVSLFEKNLSSKKEKKVGPPKPAMPPPKTAPKEENKAVSKKEAPLKDEKKVVPKSAPKKKESSVKEDKKIAAKKNEEKKPVKPGAKRKDSSSKKKSVEEKKPTMKTVPKKRDSVSSKEGKKPTKAVPKKRDSLKAVSSTKADEKKTVTKPAVPKGPKSPAPKKSAPKSPVSKKKDSSVKDGKKGGSADEKTKPKPPVPRAPKKRVSFLVAKENVGKSEKKDPERTQNAQQSPKPKNTDKKTVQ